MLIDTHSHLYSEEFREDRSVLVQNAITAGIQKIVLPNIDEDSVDDMLALSQQFPEVCYPLIGLHPTSVKSDFREKLNTILSRLSKEKFYGIGETGIDLYWDKTFQKEQEVAFTHHIKLAKELKLPVVIHVRNSFEEAYSIVNKEQDGNLTGIFHCFSGSEVEAKKVIDVGFYLGIGGVVTFKNSNLGTVLKSVNIRHVLLETDSPYLAPMPFRGKQNQSAYLIYIAQKVAEIYGMSVEEVSEITTASARKLFGF